MTEQTAQVCQVCRWWDQQEMPGDGEYGECRRHAPHPTTPPSIPGKPYHAIRGQWPITFIVDFCGEHAPIPVNRL